MRHLAWASKTWRALALPGLALALCLGAAGSTWADTGHARAPKSRVWAEPDDPNNARVIVKYRSGSALLAGTDKQAQQVQAGQSASTATAAATANTAAAPRLASAMAQRTGLVLSDGRGLGQRTQVLFGRGLSSARLVARLAAQADVEWAVVDRRRFANAVTPNDPLFGDSLVGATPTAGQWYLRAPTSTLVSATHALGAWALTLGSSSITVAVLDTGVRLDHPDLVGKLRPGYDFVSRVNTAADGDGRDADPSDPGDWSVAADTCGQAESSWHGTQVAGLVGAATDNGIGMAGLGRNVMLLPVRVLGKCGGFDSDIIAGMRWAGGVSMDPFVNPFPARVINMSLGSSGACEKSYQDVINELTAARVAVVVAAGNDAGLAVNSPANCSGAIGVAGLRHAGTKVGYSNIGSQIAIAAPAGNCVNISAGSACLYPLLTTLNSGTTTPAANIYSDSFNPSLGTSFAAPLVAGTVGLMLSLDPRLSPAQIKSQLQLSARAFPSSGAADPTVKACLEPFFDENGKPVEQLECYCTTSTCGAGMLDASAAVTRVQQALLLPTAAITASSTTPVVGVSVTLSGSGSSAAAGRSISSYLWQVVSGSANLVGANNGQTATLTASAIGSVTVRLSVTDNMGLSGTTTALLSAQAVPTPTPTPTPSTSGGGALGVFWLAGLGLALHGLRRRP